MLRACACMWVQVWHVRRRGSALLTCQHSSGTRVVAASMRSGRGAKPAACSQRSHFRLRKGRPRPTPGRVWPKLPQVGFRPDLARFRPTQGRSGPGGFEQARGDVGRTWHRHRRRWPSTGHVELCQPRIARSWPLPRDVDGCSTPLETAMLSEELHFAGHTQASQMHGRIRAKPGRNHGRDRPKVLRYRRTSHRFQADLLRARACFCRGRSKWVEFGQHGDHSKQMWPGIDQV